MARIVRVAVPLLGLVAGFFFPLLPGFVLGALDIHVGCNDGCMWGISEASALVGLLLGVWWVRWKSKETARSG